jgi:hypothetical protein
LKQAQVQIVKVLQQIEAALAPSNTKMPAPNEEGLSGHPCPTRANFWINGCESKGNYDRRARIAIHFHRGLYWASSASKAFSTSA